VNCGARVTVWWHVCRQENCRQNRIQRVLGRHVCSAEGGRTVASRQEAGDPAVVQAVVVVCCRIVVVGV